MLGISQLFLPHIAVSLSLTLIGTFSEKADIVKVVGPWPQTMASRLRHPCLARPGTLRLRQDANGLSRKNHPPLISQLEARGVEARMAMKVAPAASTEGREGTPLLRRSKLARAKGGEGARGVTQAVSAMLFRKLTNHITMRTMVWFHFHSIFFPRAFKFLSCVIASLTSGRNCFWQSLHVNFQYT